MISIKKKKILITNLNRSYILEYQFSCTYFIVKNYFLNILLPFYLF